MKKLYFLLFCLTCSSIANAQYYTTYVHPQYVGQTYVVQQPNVQPQQVYVHEVERPVYIQNNNSEAFALGVGALVGGIIGYSINNHHGHHRHYGHHPRPPMPPHHHGGFRPLYFPRR